MGLTTRPRLAAVALVSLLLVGCAWKSHMKSGDELLAAGDYDRAAQQYSQALALKPQEQELRVKLERARAGQVQERATAARARLVSGDNAGAVQLAGQALTIAPQHEVTVSLIDEVVRTVGARAKANADAGEFAAAMRLYNTIAVGLPMAAPQAQSDSAAVARAWVVHLAPQAEAAERRGFLATSLLLRAKIAVLEGRDLGATEPLRTRLDGQLRYLVRITGTSGDAGLGSVVRAIEGAYDPALVTVSQTAEADRAALSLSIAGPRFESQRADRQASVQYQSGTQMVPNPFYESARRDVLNEERRLMDAENEVTRQEEYVSQYSQDVAEEGDTPGTTTGAEQNLSNAQSRLTAARRNVESARNNVMRAKERLVGTPQMTQEPVYATHAYTVATHTRLASIDVRGEITHGDGRPNLSLSTPLSVSASDEAHAAQSIAGISSDPLNLPSDASLSERLYADAVLVVKQVILDSFDGYRSTLLAAAESKSNEQERLESLARYALVDPTRVEPQVVAQIEQMCGVPEADRLLTPR